MLDIKNAKGESLAILFGESSGAHRGIDAVRCVDQSEIWTSSNAAAVMLVTPDSSMT